MPEDRAAGGGAVSAESADGERCRDVAMFCFGFFSFFFVRWRERERGNRGHDRSSRRRQEEEREAGASVVACSSEIEWEASESERRVKKREAKNRKEEGKKNVRLTQSQSFFNFSVPLPSFLDLSPLAAGTQKPLRVSNRPAPFSRDVAGDQSGRKWRLSGGASSRLKEGLRLFSLP